MDPMNFIVAKNIERKMGPVHKQTISKSSASECLTRPREKLYRYENPRIMIMTHFAFPSSFFIFFENTRYSNAITDINGSKIYIKPNLVRLISPMSARAQFWFERLIYRNSNKRWTGFMPFARHTPHQTPSPVTPQIPSVTASCFRAFRFLLWTI